MLSTGPRPVHGIYVPEALGHETYNRTGTAEKRDASGRRTGGVTPHTQVRVDQSVTSVTLQRWLEPELGVHSVTAAPSLVAWPPTSRRRPVAALTRVQVPSPVGGHDPLGGRVARARVGLHHRGAVADGQALARQPGW